MRTLHTVTALLILTGCPRDKDDTAPPEDSVRPVDSPPEDSPPEDTQGETGQTGDSSPPEDTGPITDEDADGFSPDEGDCDDGDPTVFPGADEACNGVDDDCDGATDEDPCSGDCDAYVPQDFATIQAAIDTLPDGAEICLDSGRYHEALVLEERSLAIRGVYGSWSTILDADFTATTLVASGDASHALRLEGLTLQSGTGELGGGLLLDGVTASLTDLTVIDSGALRGGGLAVTGAASVQAQGLRLEANRASEDGGGLLLDAGTQLVVEELELLDNVAATGSGGGLYASEAWLEADGFDCTGNEVAWLAGGCVAVADSTLMLTDLQASGNLAWEYGGGLNIDGTSEAWLTAATVHGNAVGTWDYGSAAGLRIGGTATLDAQDLVVTDNDFWYQGNGAGLLTTDDAVVTATDVLIQGNEADQSAALNATGAELRLTGCLIEDNDGSSATVYLNGGQVTLSDCMIVDNHADGDCAGLGFGSGDFTLERVLVAGNSAGGDGGGLCFYHRGPAFQAEGLIVIDNQAADDGGGVYGNCDSGSSASSTLALAHSVIAGNTAGDEGGGLFLEGHGEVPLEVSIRDSVISGNTASEGGGVYAAETVQLAVEHSVAHGNGPEDWLGIADPSGTDGNLDVDPAFLASGTTWWEDWDLHLSSTSPLVDAGSDTDPDGSPADIGAYGGPDASSWDLDGDGYPLWWHPGPYDPHSDPAAGWDCDDRDETVYPGSGC